VTNRAGKRAAVVAVLAAAALAGALSPLRPASAWTCEEDIRKFCKDVTPGSGRIERCLREHESQVSPECREKRLKIRDTVRGALEACLPEARKFCEKVPAGEARILRCLKEHEDDLSPACRSAARGLEDLFGKGHPCQGDQERFCGDVVPGEGRVMNCMAEHRPDLSDGCNAFLEDALNQATEKVVEVGQEFMDACQADLQKHCRGIPPGKGRLAECLREHEDATGYSDRLPAGRRTPASAPHTDP